MSALARLSGVTLSVTRQPLLGQEMKWRMLGCRYCFSLRESFSRSQPGEKSEVVKRERGHELDSAWLSLLYLLLGDHLGEQAQVLPRQSPMMI